MKISDRGIVMIAETARIYTDKLGKDLEIRDYSIVYQNVELKDNVLVGEHSVVGRIPTTTSTMVKTLSDVLRQSLMKILLYVLMLLFTLMSILARIV